MKCNDDLFGTVFHDRLNVEDIIFVHFPVVFDVLLYNCNPVIVIVEVLSRQAKPARRDFCPPTTLAELEREEIAIRSSLESYHRQAKKWSDAIAQLDLILTARPNSFQDYYRRGLCYRALKDHAAATRDFRRFLQLQNLSEDHVAVKDAQSYLQGRGE